MSSLLPEILSGLAAVAVAATSTVALHRARHAVQLMRSREGARAVEMTRAREAIARDVEQLLSTRRMDRDATKVIEDLLEHLNDVDRAVLLVDDVLVAKSDGHVQVRRLDSREQQVMADHPDWLRDPQVLARLDATIAPGKHE